MLGAGIKKDLLKKMKNLLQKDQAYIWHPFTQMKDCAANPPIIIKAAKGIKLFDVNGKEYYDTISSWWCNLHGHRHPKIIKAINRQLAKFDHVMFAGFTHEPAIKLAEKLVQLNNNDLQKVFFSDNGSTAVEVALKLSFQYWYNLQKPQKTLFLAFDHAYHGDTVGAMSVSGESIFNQAFKNLMIKTIKIPTPYCCHCPENLERESCQIKCIRHLENFLAEQHNQIAAFILEPLLLAAGGMIIYPAKYLELAAALCKKYQVHLILDEVATGFGRTGTMFSYQQTSIQPDFLCLAKGLTNGMLPLAVTLTTNNIYNAFYDDFLAQKTFYHGHTFTANPIAVSAALANLKIFEKENTLQNVKQIEAVFNQELVRFKDLPFIGDVRYLGVVAAFELIKDKSKNISFAFEERIGQKIYLKGLEFGLILRPLGNVVYLFLPLVTTKKQLYDILLKLEMVFSYLYIFLQSKKI
ncbi:MAG: adenosylmethionine--8-amino-7-oxononanoate transaminase [Candidatus Margulisiibacteriota bacterium]|jgi:adenosylmethionine-8-amino-7-oxononanoate aminotransferase